MRRAIARLQADEIDMEQARLQVNELLAGGADFAPELRETASRSLYSPAGSWTRRKTLFAPEFRTSKQAKMSRVSNMTSHSGLMQVRLQVLSSVHIKAAPQSGQTISKEEISLREIRSIFFSIDVILVRFSFFITRLNRVRLGLPAVRWITLGIL